MGSLDGRIALVTGATRGAGRGTAVALGEAGATVYCTGRSTRERRSEYDRPETIEETAELVTGSAGPASRSPSIISRRTRSRRSPAGSTPRADGSTSS
jgi:NAD(P)-dependent dehydrogenase (short-subunit alcohol dehydrogenase family)